MTRGLTRKRAAGPFWLGAVLLASFTVNGMAQEALPPPVEPLAADSEPTENSTASAEPAELNTPMFLQRTEPFVRAPRPEELIPLGVELQARGLPDAARGVYSSLATNAVELAPLVEQCLALGQFSAAEAVLDRWRKKDPRDPKAAMLAIVLWYAQGHAELALREITASGDRVAAEDQALLRLVSDLGKQALRGGTPGVEENPWGIRFVGEDGSYQAGAIAPAELAKLPPGIDQALLRLLALVPKQGSLWGLAGEILNARGDTAAALVCMKRAEALLYTPRLLRDHRRVLESSRREAELQAEQAMDQAMGTSPAKELTAAQPSASPAGWDQLAARPKILIVVILGGLFVLWIAALQIREWRRPAKRR